MPDLFKNLSLPIYIVFVIASVFFLWGGITCLKAKKDPQKIVKGKKILLWTISGFVIILFAIFVANLINNFLQKGGSFQSGVIETTTEEFPPAPPPEKFPPAP